MNAVTRIKAQVAAERLQRRYDYSQLIDIANASARLHDAAVRAGAVPNYPENAQVIAGLEEFVTAAIKNMKEALNG